MLGQKWRLHRTQALAAAWDSYWRNWWSSRLGWGAPVPVPPEWRILKFDEEEQETSASGLPLTLHVEVMLKCLPDEAEHLQAAYALGGIQALRVVLEAPCP